MVIENIQVKEKLKNIIRNRQYQYQRFDKKRKMGEKQPNQTRQFFKAIANIIHRFICLIGRFIFKKVYGEKGDKVPPVKNLLLLDPATVLAMKIRTRKVTSVEVVKAFIERIQVCIIRFLSGAHDMQGGGTHNKIYFILNLILNSFKLISINFNKFLKLKVASPLQHAIIFY